MLISAAYVLALIANLLWFLAGFRYFSFKQSAAAKMLVPASARSSPLFATIAAATRFLGGFNGAFAFLALLLLTLLYIGSPLFSNPQERAALLMVFAAAHFSQFVFNIPIIRGGQRQGESFWPVLSGPMLFIFVIDGLETIINLAAAACLLFISK
jgi:hypothetical protein